MSLATLKEKIKQLIRRAEDEKLWYQRSCESSDTFANRLFKDTQLTRLPRTNLSKNTSMDYFITSSKVESIDYYINSESALSMITAFGATSNLKYMVGVNTASCTNINSLFQNSGIETIDEPFDFSNVTTANALAFSCGRLKDICFVPKTIKVSLKFTSTLLTTKSKQSIFDGLAVVTTAQTLTLNANLKILQSQVDSANAKGWTVAGGTIASEEEYYG